jgi:predicted porin
MKKSLLALATLTAFAGVASAQSSVTVFGIVDLAARNVKNGSASLKTLSHSGNATSRLGFRGVEDLGGGLKAGFWLEGEIQGDTGNAGGMNWTRRATTSLMGDFGEVRLGRDYVPTFWNHTQFDPFGTNGVGSQTNMMEQFLPTTTSTMFGAGAGTRTRANNTIGYHLPSMGGLYGQVMVAAGEGATGNKYTGARLGYAAGPVNVAGAFGKTEINPTRDLTAVNVAASFNAGFMTVFGQWHKYKVTSPNLDQTNIMIGATVPMGAGTFKASYAKASSEGTARDGTQIALGYVYDLSKRTAVYTSFSRINNGIGARFSVASSTANGAPAFTGTSTDPSSTGYEFGLRHSF